MKHLGRNEFPFEADSPVQVAPILAYRYRTVLCTRTAVGSPVIFRFRAELAFSARSESNPVLILPLRDRTKTYLHTIHSIVWGVGRLLPLLCFLNEF